jgi:hypothetical protein
VRLDAEALQGRDERLATRAEASAELPVVGGEWRRIVRSGSR